MTESSLQSNAVAIRPMTLGTLLDKSLKMTPSIFKQVLLIYIVLAVFDSGMNYLQGSGQLELQSVALIAYIILALIRSVVGYCVFLMLPFLTAAYWRGDVSYTAKQAWSKVTWPLAWKGIGLSLIVSFGTLFFMIFLIIPGIIYMVNRILAFYILLIEETTVKEAIAKSKQVMKHGTWYKSNSPIFRVAAIGFAIFVISMIVGIVVGIGSVGSAHSGFGMAANGAVFFLHSLFTSVVQLFSIAAYTGLYFDAIARFEGADLISDLKQ